VAKRLTLAVLAAVFCTGAVLINGCAVALVGAGAGTVAYIKGSLEAVLEDDVDAVYEASIKALDQLEIAPSEKQKDALAARIVATNAQYRKITIKLKAAENDLTKISIKIGFFGDRSQSQAIYDKIKENLQNP
jgi:hypothetical protein